MSVLGQVRDVLELLAPQRAMVERLGDPGLAGAYHFRLGLSHSILGEQEAAIADASRAVADATRCGDDATRGKASYLLSLASFWSGRPVRGVEPGERAVQLLQGSSERHFLGLANWALALNRLLLGEFAGALEAAAEAESVGQELGDPRLLTLAASSTGWVHATMGDAERGLAACRLAFERARDPMSQAAAEGYLGYAHLERGEARTALPHLERSAAGLAKLALRQVQGRVQAWLALAHLACGHLDEARAAARQSLEAARIADCRDVMAQAQSALGRIAAAAHAVAEARGHLMDALAGFEEIGARFEAARTRLALSELALSEGDRAAAGAELDRARELFLALRSGPFVARVDALRRSLYRPVRSPRYQRGRAAAP